MAGAGAGEVRRGAAEPHVIKAVGAGERERRIVVAGGIEGMEHPAEGMDWDGTFHATLSPSTRRRRRRAVAEVFVRVTGVG